MLSNKLAGIEANPENMQEHPDILVEILEYEERILTILTRQ
jgi:hypothetical protein